MNGNFERCLALVLKSEGGFVNNSADPGGMTNLGVTKDTYEAWVNRTVDEAEMRSLTPDVVAPIYKNNYWDRVVGNELPVGVDYCVFDAAVNLGPSQAIKLIQRALNVVDDGILGEKTLAASHQRDAAELIEQFSEEHLQLMQTKKTWATFAKGFQNRIDFVKETALQMVLGS